jgi:predicted amidohydrolase
MITKTKNNALLVDMGDFVEIRKRAKQAAILAALNPRNELDSTQQKYIEYCSQFLIELIDAHRITKSSFCIENRYFSVYCNQVISDECYPNLLKKLTTARRKMAVDNKYEQ